MWLLRRAALVAALLQPPGGADTADSGQVEIACAASDPRALAAALLEADGHRQAGKGVRVQLQGRYRLDSPLSLGRPVAAAPGGLPPLVVRGPAVLDGGVPVTGWARDPTRPWLWAAPVPTALRGSGITITQLFDGERRVPPARTPVLHYEQVGALNVTSGMAKSLIVNATSTEIPRTFAQLSAVRLFLYHSWDISFHPLAEVRQLPGGLRELVVGNLIKTLWGVGAGAPGYRYFLEGAEEFLHEGSGTFAHDVDGGRLLYAPAGGAPGKDVSAPRLVELVRTDGASDVTLESLTLQHSAVDFSGCFAPDSFCEMQSAADQTVAALHWTDSQRITIANLTLRHTGSYGFWFDHGCRDVQVSRSHLHDLGAGGVRMTGVRNATLADSVLEDGGKVWRHGAGVLMQTANHSVVTHNTIRRFSYTAISVGWTWGFAPTLCTANEIAFNAISTIGQGELSDLGCIYHLGTDIGTVIESNTCFNITSYNYGGWGLYLDEGTSNVTVRGNLVHETKSAGFVQHYGIGNAIENNLLYRVDLGLGPTNWSDGGIGSGAADAPGSPEDRSSFAFRRNIVVVESGPLFSASTENGYRDVQFDSNVYFDLSASSVRAGFPCSPSGNRSWLSSPNCLNTSSGKLVSGNGQATVGFNASGYFNLQHGGSGATLWSAPIGSPTASLNFSTNEACIQNDAQFIIFERATPRNRILWAADKASMPAGPYFAAVGDDCSFCTWAGSPNGPGQPHPSLAKAVWCGFRGPCPVGGGATSSTEGFPTTCSMASWQARGQDIRSVVTDPMIAAGPGAGEWRLRPGSPALKLGFAQLNVSRAGPRPVHAPTAPVLLGCFADCKAGVNTSQRAMCGGDATKCINAGNLPQTDSPAACAALCAGFDYIGLQDGQNCFCGNLSGAHGYASQGVSVKCTIPCTGDKAVMCGGPCANSGECSNDRLGR